MCNFYTTSRNRCIDVCTRVIVCVKIIKTNMFNSYFWRYLSQIRGDNLNSKL